MNLPSNAQKKYIFFDIGYGIDYALNNNFVSHFAYNKGVTFNVGSFAIGTKVKNLHLSLGVSIQKRKLDYPCTTFETDTNTIQIHPNSIIFLEDNSSLCTYSYLLETNFLEIPIRFGYNFPSDKKIQYYLEGVYAPLIRMKSTRVFTYLDAPMSSSSSYYQDANNKFQSWSNLAINCGFQRPITQKINFKFGLNLKSNDFQFNKLLLGADLRLQYIL